MGEVLKIITSQIVGERLFENRFHHYKNSSQASAINCPSSFNTHILNKLILIHRILIRGLHNQTLAGCG